MSVLAMAVLFRRRKGRRNDDWHFHQACIRWPDENYIEEVIPPRNASLCPRCALLYNGVKS